MTEESMTFTFTFVPPKYDKAFWLAAENKARHVDFDTQGSQQINYTHREVFTILFHQDGLETLSKIAADLRAHLGWSIDTIEFDRDITWVEASENESVVIP